MIMFFKQKSSYEGRISDWSSDVCSSDLLLRSDSVLRDPDHLLGYLDVDIGSLDLLRDIEPDDPPVRLGEDHAPFGERHARRTLATAFDRLRIGDGHLGLLDKTIASRPGGIVHIHRDGWVRADPGLDMVGARGVAPSFARATFGRCGNGPLDRLVER